MKKIKLFITMLFLMITTNAFAQNVSCLVVGVTDGDTIRCLTSEKVQLKIRLAQIDAPESRQAFGTVSKKALSDLIYKKNVIIKINNTDRYGRSIGEIYLNGKNINKTMVANGYAWAYKEYMSDNEYIDLENYARKNKLGLWVDKDPIYPSQFRRSF